MTHRALLIGVNQYAPSTRIPPLLVAGYDVGLMAGCLSTRGYRHIVRSVEKPEHMVELTKSGIRRSIRDFIRSAEPGDHLLIYASGHGFHYKGVDYLVPADFSCADGDADELVSELVSLDLSPICMQSRAATVILIVDACREPLSFATKGFLHFEAPGGSGPDVDGLGSCSLAVMYSCRANSLSGFDPDKLTHGSYFTQALLFALDCTDGDFQRVIKHANEWLHNHKPPINQEVWWRIVAQGPAGHAFPLPDRWLASGNLSEEPIRIALAGHVNAGKTSLVTTLLRRQTGIIAVTANTTQEEAEFRSDGLQAVFIDCPGFQNATGLEWYLSTDDSDKRDKLEQRLNLAYDLRAFRALQRAEVVLYVASLEVDPESPHKVELDLVLRSGRPVIGVINKAHLARRMFSAADFETRLQAWLRFLGDVCKAVVVYDCHWDRPSRVRSLHDAVLALLDPDRKPSFEAGLAMFRATENRDRDTIADLFSEFVCTTKSLRTVLRGSDHSYDKEKVQKAGAADLRSRIDALFLAYVGSVSGIFGFQIENLAQDILDAFSTDHSTSTAIWDVVKSAALGAGFGGGGGAGAGALIGAAFAGLLSGGLGAAAGAALGAQIGGAIGSLGLGLLAGSADLGEHYEFRPSRALLAQVANSAISVAWALMFHGFGRGPVVNAEWVWALQNQVSRSLDCTFDWSAVSRETAKAEFFSTLEKLDTERPSEYSG